jgi:hypothetical protein
MTDAAPASPDVMAAAGVAKAALYLRVSTGRQYTPSADPCMPYPCWSAPISALSDQCRQERAKCSLRDARADGVDGGRELDFRRRFRRTFVQRECSRIQSMRFRSAPI